MEVQAVVEAQAAMREQASDQRVSERPIACERDSEKEEREQEGGRTCVCVRARVHSERGTPWRGKVQSAAR